MYDSNEQQTTNPSRHYNVLRKITLEKGLKADTGYEVVDEEPALHYYWQTVKKGQEIEGFVVHSSKVAAIEQLNQTNVANFNYRFRYHFHSYFDTWKRDDKAIYETD